MAIYKLKFSFMMPDELIDEPVGCAYVPIHGTRRILKEYYWIYPSGKRFMSVNIRTVFSKEFNKTIIVRPTYRELEEEAHVYIGDFPDNKRLFHSLFYPANSAISLADMCSDAARGPEVNGTPELELRSWTAIATKKIFSMTRNHKGLTKK